MSPLLPDDSGRRDDLDAALGAAKRRLKRVAAAVAFGAWLAWTVLFALMFVVVDHWLSRGVPDWPRAAATRVYLLASGIWLAAALVWPMTRRINDLYAARLVERCHPEFRNSLIDALQLSEHDELPGSVRSAVVAQAADEVAGVDVRASVPTRRLRRVGFAVVAMAAVFGLYAMVSPKPVLPSLTRAFGSGTSAPTRTRIGELRPDDGASVLRGEPVRFALRVGGKAPASAIVRFSLDGGSTWVAGQQLELRPAARDAPREIWEAVKAGRDVQRTVAWQAVAGDAASEVRHLEVRPIPETTGVSVQYEYPAYTHLAPATQPGGAIDAVVGTRATILASANVPIQDPILITGRAPGEKRRILAGPAALSPTELAATLTVTADDVYRLAYRDGHGEPNREPIFYPIHARADQPPTVRIDRPGPQTEMLAEEVFDLRAHAEDDFGLTRAALSYRRAGQEPAKEIPLPVATGPGSRSCDIEERIAVSQIGAEPGAVLEWWVSVWDNREDLRGEAACQRSDGEIRRMVIREPESLAALSEKRSEQDSQEDRRQDSDVPPASSGEADAGDQPAATESLAGRSRTPAGSPQVAQAEKSGTRAVAGETATAQDAAGLELANSNGIPNEPRASARAAAQTAVVSPGPPEVLSDAGEAQRESRAIQEFAEDHADELNTLAGYLSESLQESGAPAGEPGSADKAESETAGGGQATRPADADERAGVDARAGREDDPSQGSSEEREEQETAAASSRGPNDGKAEAAAGGKAERQADAAGEGSPPSVSDGQAKRQAKTGSGRGQPQAGTAASPGGKPSDGEGGRGDAPGSSSASAEGKGAGSTTGGGGAPSDPTMSRSIRESAVDGEPPVKPAAPARVGKQILAPGRVERLMNALDLALRRGEVAPEMLDALGWDLVRTEQFVEQYERLKVGAQPQVERTPLPTETLETETSGDAAHRTLRAERGLGPGTSGLDVVYQPGSDATHDLMEVGRQRIPQRYQPLLEAYYRSVGTQPAD